MRDFSGQSLGRYHLIGKLGEGGMAVVYKAFDTRLECEVAVKIIRVEDLPQSGVERALKRFEREAKAVAQLNHPNIVRVMDYGEQDGLPYLVMPYQPGGTLKGLLGKPIPYQEAAHLLAPVARALQYAHEHNVIHRDVKPSNILLTDSAELILTDFGIAKILDLQEGQTLTGTGLGIGTPEYMAPEQWTGAITPTVDIYSLGVVFYELVTGHKPYTAETPAAVLLKQATEPLPGPSSYVPGIPEKVEQVIYKAMAKKVENRYGSMQEFEKALEQVKAGAILLEFRAEKTIQSKERPNTNVTVDTFTSHLQSDVGKKLGRDEALQEPETGNDQPTRITNNRKGRIIFWIGLGILTFLGAGFLIGQAMNWFGGNSPFVTLTPVVTENFIETETPNATEAPQGTETSSLGIGSTMISPIDSMEMVYVPAGDFIMGSSDIVSPEAEHPQHTVYMDAYWIDQTEVTIGMYAKCVAAGQCTKPSSESSFTRKSYYGNPTYANYPVIYVSWDQAQTYCQWAGRKLPTEAQWEKAARGEDGLTFPWGDQSPAGNLMNFADVNLDSYWSDQSINDGYGDTAPVGNYPDGASPYGVLDMAGNVWEWTADWYDAAYYSCSPQNNPPGPVNGDSRILRGGSWSYNVNAIRSAFRRWIVPSYSHVSIGFRCATPAY